MANGYNGAGTLDSFNIEDAHVRRQRSMKFSLYPAGPARPRTASKSSTPSGPTTPISPTAPQIPHQFHSSREESLQYQRPYTSHHPQSQESRAYTSPAVQHNLHKRPSEASRLRALNNGYRSQSSDGRNTPERRNHTPEPTHIDNFSRPRAPSLRRRNDSPKRLNHNSSTFPLQIDEERTPTDLASSRDRGFSASSSQSAANVTSHPLRPSPSIPDYGAPESIYSRQRNLNNPAYRSQRRDISGPDSIYTSQRREPITRPGFDSEEVRASFRSALTTNSSFLGTSGTERSSVLTKSSSATSIYGRDEGMSVDDAIGMYEGGFQTDSGVEDNYGTRPITQDSEKKRISGLEEAMNDMLMVPPSNVIMRDSTQIFSTNGGRGTPSPEPGPKEEMLEVQEKYFDQQPLSPTRPTTGRPTTGRPTTGRPTTGRPVTGRPVTRAAMEPFDETRDRYGFKKKSQHISLEQYEAWNGPYKEHLARRRKKWVALMKDSNLPSDKPERFPPQSARVKRFIRKGIPPDWRGAAWWYYAGGPKMLALHPGEYNILVQKAEAGGVSETDDEIIERDLNRTFPDNIKFKPDPPPGEPRDSVRSAKEPETPIVQSLRRVLQAFSIQNPKIGYCQSLNFLAGLLLLFMDEEKSFWMLNIITRVYLPGTHELNLEGANVDLGVLMSSIKDNMPAIWAKIGGELDGSSVPHSHLRLPPITLCTTAWFMSCFIGTLPIESTLRVWDCFFYEGSKTLFRIAMTIFKLGEQEIKAVSDPMEIFQVVQTIPRRLIDCNTVLETCYKRRNGFGHLSQDTIEKGRAERRKGYAEEREREKREQSGHVAGTTGLGRQGTRKGGGLTFGRKKRAMGTPVEV
ncbi:RabGAP/TBC [Acephala macrosclerotiorum]|nr:RabGAP/TBC [Acephala macrosclerotiorum]